MPSIEFPYKILSVGQPLGGVFEDRAAGVAGVLGKSLSIFRPLPFGMGSGLGARIQRGRDRPRH